MNKQITKRAPRAKRMQLAVIEEPVTPIEEIPRILPRNPRKSRSKSRGGFGTNSIRKAKLHYNSTTIVAGVTAQFGVIQFQFDQFEGFADYSTVYDTYRLRKCEVRFMPKVNQQSLTGKAVATTIQVSYLLVVKDYDDSNVPSTLSELYQYNDIHIPKLFDEMTVSLRPKVSTQVYAGGITVGYAQSPDDTWLDVANNDIEHYGLKWGTSAGGASQTTFQEWYVIVTGWFEFQQPR